MQSSLALSNGILITIIRSAMIDGQEVKTFELVGRFLVLYFVRGLQRTVSRANYSSPTYNSRIS